MRQIKQIPEQNKYYIDKSIVQNGTSEICDIFITRWGLLIMQVILFGA